MGRGRVCGSFCTFAYSGLASAPEPVLHERCYWTAYVSSCNSFAVSLGAVLLLGKMSDHDDIFITQSKFTQENISDTNVIDNILDMEEGYPTFDIRTDLYSDISEFESGEDEALIKATQEAEERLTKERFGPVLTDKDLNDLIDTSVPKNTQSKCKWAVNTFESWRKNRNGAGSKNFPKHLLHMEEEELDTALCFFLGEVRTVSGKEYQPKTLYEIIIAIQHFLRYSDRNVNFLNDPAFNKMKRVLDAKMKELSKKGLGINRKQADVITTHQENLLWEKGILGTDTPQKLLQTLVYSIGLNFALRAGQEHRNLRTGPTSQLKVVESDIEGRRRYLMYTEDVSKTNCGGLLHRKVEPKVTRAYENPECPERCIVRMYETYMGKR